MWNRRKYEMGKRMFSLLLAMVMVLGLFAGVNTGNVIFADLATDDLQFTDVYIEYDGNPVAGNTITEPLEKDATIKFYFDWALDNSVDNSDGMTISTQLPEAMKYGSGVDNQPLVGGYGTWSISSTGVLSILLNEKGGGESNVSGKIEFELDFRLNEEKVEVPYIFEIPLTDSASETFSVMFDMSENDAVAKDGEGDDSNKNLIHYDVDVNMNLQNLTNPVLEDNLDDRVALVPGSVKLYPIHVYSDGTYTVDDDEYTGFSTTVTGTDPVQIQLNTTTSSAYRISYDALVKELDTSETVFTYSNTASFNGEQDSKNVRVEREGELLDKDDVIDHAYNGDSINWTLDVNTVGYPLTNARVEDTLPSGIVLDTDSVVVTNETDSTTLTKDVEYSLSYEGNILKVIFEGDDDGIIYDAYKIAYTTSISDDLKKTDAETMAIENDAVLYVDNVNVKEVTAGSNSFKKGTYIQKSATKSIGYNAEKYIDWTVDLNRAEVAVGKQVYTDVIGAGHELMDASEDNYVEMKVYALTIDQETGSVSGTDSALTAGADYTLTVDDSQNFNIDFGSEITSAYRITYRTKITDIDAGSYNNKGYYGDGTGTADVDKNYNPGLGNVYDKAYLGIDYVNLTQDWKLTVNPIKEAIEELVITDNLSSGLMMTEAQYNAITVKHGSSTLGSGNYTKTSVLENGVIKGFVIDFKVKNYVLNDDAYYITYSTTMDPDVVANNGDLTYNNTATFEHSESGATPLTKTPTVNLPDDVLENGDKAGEIDLTDREIDWTIRTNMLSKNLDGFTLVDTLEGNQRLKSGSIEIYTYTLEDSASNNNSTVKTSSSALVIDPTALGFVITETGDDTGLRGFTIQYPASISEPYMIKYTSEFFDISETDYVNSAVTPYETYTASVPHEDAQKFVAKDGNIVDDSVIEWTVTLNTSKSTISDLVITDTFSYGLKLDEDSFVLKDVNGDTTELASLFGLEVTEYLITEQQSYTLTLKEGVEINDIYTLVYETEIIKDLVVDGEVSNKVVLSGNEKISGTTEASVSYGSTHISGIGTGSGVTGGFKLVKTDNNDDPVVDARFEFYKVKDDGDLLLGELVSDSNGEASVDNLKYGTYKLVEIIAPDGYLISEETTVFEIDSTVQKSVEIENDKKAELGNFVWYDIDKDGIQDPYDDTTPEAEKEKGVANVKVSLFDSNDDQVGDPVYTDSDGYYLFTDLFEDDYWLEFEMPDGYSVTDKDAGSDDAEDSDGVGDGAIDTLATIENISISYGDSDMTYDLGIYQPAGLGNYVWLDSNYDGIQNDSEGVEGVTVTLYKVGSTGAYDTATTDSNGGYHFTDLPPGDYYVVFEIPDTYYLTISNSDGDSNDTDSGPIISSDGTSATSKTVTLAPDSSNLTLDMGLYQLASLGDYVWYDTDKDGTQDDDEEPVVGLTVTLFDSEGATVGTSVTGEDGGYLFDDLLPGTYSLQFDALSGYRFTTQDAVDSETSENDDSTDSDADSSGLISGITLVSGQHDPDNDAGFRKKSSSSSSSSETTTEETTTTATTTVTETTTTTTEVPTTTVEAETTVSTTPLFQKETTSSAPVVTTTAADGTLPQPTTAPPAPTYPDEIIYKPNRDLTDVVIKDEPDKGTVEIIDGEIVYSPGVDFDGTDRIVLLVTNPDGSEEEIVIDIFEELPEAGMPATGGIPTDVFIGFGMTFFGLGFGLRSKKQR